MSIRYLCEIGNPVTHRFSTAVRNPIDKHNATYPDSAGNPILYLVRMSIPNLKNKISDSISGSIKIPQQTIKIKNDDGKYDDVEDLGWFNIPIVIKRCDIVNPTLADFEIIFKGIIDYSDVSFSEVSIKTNPIYRSLTEEVTKTFNIDDFPNIPDGNLDKNIPIAYGPNLKRVPLFEIDSTDPTKYMAIDSAYLTGVDAVYDDDDNSISFSVSAGVITATDAKTADISGATGNSIGDIITSEIALKSGIDYNDDNWDTLETSEYINNSGHLNIYFEGGTVRQFVDKCLKSDNAFCFTKNNGLQTIRQWGRIYKVHKLKAWKLAKVPDKKYADAKRYYNSLALVKYQKNISTGIYERQNSSGITPQFDQDKKVDYETDLYILGEVIDLADRMIKRFGIVSENMTIAAGEPAININLLDLIEIDVNINGRQFSNKKEWIVREVDPGQDVLTLEARSGFITPETIPGTLSQPMFDGIDGTLSQPLSIYSTEIIDGVLSKELFVIE